MTLPTRRPRSSFFQYRKRVPADIQKAAHGQLAGFTFPADAIDKCPLVVHVELGRQVKFSLQTRDPVTAKERTGLATAQRERLYEAIRSGPRPLTRKQIVGLAGLIYNGFAKGGGDDPGPASVWARISRGNEDASKGRFGRTSLMIVADGKVRPRTSLEERFGAMADALLTTQGIITDSRSREALIEELVARTT